MSATATFHARRLSRPVAGRARAFGGVGEKDLTFVVTTEGKVYERNTGLFSRLAEYELEYDAKTKTTGSVIDIDVKDDAARRLEATIESSYVTLDEAKNRADEVLAMKGEKPVPADPSPAAPSPAPEAAPPAAGSEGGPPAAGGGEKSDIPWGYIAAGFGGVVVVGGIIYFATRK